MKFPLLRVFTWIILILLLLSWPLLVFGQANMYIRPVEIGPSGSHWFLYEVEPGAIIKDSVKIVNNADFSQQVRIRPVDGLSLDNGGFGLKNSDPDLQEWIGAWIRIDNTESISIKPHETKDFPFTIHIPKDIEPGDY